MILDDIIMIYIFYVFIIYNVNLGSSTFENFLQSECQTDQTQLSFHLQSLATVGARFGRMKF